MGQGYAGLRGFAVDEDGVDRKVVAVAARERLDGAAIFPTDVGGHESIRFRQLPYAAASAGGRNTPSPERRPDGLGDDPKGREH